MRFIHSYFCRMLSQYQPLHTRVKFNFTSKFVILKMNFKIIFLLLNLIIILFLRVDTLDVINKFVRVETLN